MKALLLAALLAQADPQIEKIERLTGPVRRPWQWAPLAVTLSSAGGYKGDVTVRSELGIYFARRVEIAAGGRRRVLVAAIDPVEISAGVTVEPVPPATESAETLIAVVEGAEVPPSAEGIHYQRISRDDLREISSWGAVDAFDGVERWCFRGISSVDPALWALAPREDWVPVKKDSTVLFATIYVFAAFVLLFRASRRGTAAVLGSTVVLAVLFGAGYFVFFPTGTLWGEEHSCEVVSGTPQDVAIRRAWFFRAESQVRTRIDFPCLVKPVFPQARPAESPFTIRQEGTTSSVEGLELPSGGSACFVGVESGVNRPVRFLDGWVVRGGRYGRSAPADVVEEVPTPQDADFRGLVQRFVTDRCLFGRLDDQDRTLRDVRSPDLAEVRGRPRWMVVQDR